MSFKLSVIFLMLTGWFVTPVANDWELVKSEENIQVFVRKKEGSKFKEVKIKGLINCKMSELVMALEDVEAQKDWVNSTIDARYISKDQADHFYFYISTDFPYPVKDRDVAIEYKRQQDPNTRIVTIDYLGVADKEPEHNKFVRIPDFKAQYILKPLANGQIDVEYYLRADVGGSIPKWIVNMAITKGPLDTIESLFNLITSGHYKNLQVEGVLD